ILITLTSLSGQPPRILFPGARLRGALVILMAAIGAAQAQEPIEYDADAWIAIPFAERASLFEQEARDADWAPTMERAIAEEVADFDRPMEERVPPGLCDRFPVCRDMPPVQLVDADCRTTLCRIEMHWPPDATRAAVGQ